MGDAVRVGLIGGGRWGQVYLRTLRSLGRRVRVTHLAVRHPGRLQGIPAGISIKKDWRQLIRADCDAVIIATPPSAHAMMLDACLDARKPCIVEKPLCLDVPTAERLHRRVAASHVPVLVDHTQLFHPAYRRLKQTLASRREPMRAILSEGMSLGPFRSDTPALWDWCPHDLSLCLDLVGCVPRRVDGLGGPLSPSGSPEMVSLRLEFPGDTVAWIQAGCLAPYKRRNLSVFTDTRLYVLDDMAREPLSVSRIKFSKRYVNVTPMVAAKSSTAPVSRLSPLASVITYFVEGLAGGDRTLFGTSLALDVNCTLARCEAALRGAGKACAERIG